MTEHNEQNEGWNFDNSYARLPEILYTKQSLNPVSAPKLAILNESLADSLGLDLDALKSLEGLQVLAGSMIPEGAAPLAQAYAGHQFGHFNMLGDGRAILLGEQMTPTGERFDVQLKGAGRTKYSRGGDGRAALGPMLREYIISEAMHALGISTTRSLAVVTTGEPVYRETELPGAILTRVAASHLRVGTFQFAAQWGTKEDLKTLADYAINRHYPEVEAEDYLSFLKNVIAKQAALVAQWQHVGFIHGVMNADNMTISGETIDYGPCAFMDAYNPGTVFSSIDRDGRYAYANQPYIAGWNLARFAETLIPLLHENQEQALELAQSAISDFSKIYKSNWLAGMRGKLGLLNEEPGDEDLINRLLNMMEQHGDDYTNTFAALTTDCMSDAALFETKEFTQWHEQWRARRNSQPESEQTSKELMEKSNPAVIPRNHRVEAALEAAVQHNDYGVMEELLQVLSNPYDHTAGHASDHTLPDSTDRPYKTYCGT